MCQGAGPGLAYEVARECARQWLVLLSILVVLRCVFVEVLMQQQINNKKQRSA